MHTGTICFCLWLRHKCGMKSMAFCHNTNCHLKSCNAVGNLTNLAITKINLMLCRSGFMMGRFNFISHVFQIQHHITSCIFSKIQRTDIQISRLLMCHSRRIAIVIGMEQEKLTFRIDITGIAFFLCLACHVFQNISRTVFVRCTIRKIQITDHSGYFSLLWTPWQNCKSIQYRAEIKV